MPPKTIVAGSKTGFGTTMFFLGRQANGSKFVDRRGGSSFDQARSLLRASPQFPGHRTLPERASDSRAAVGPAERVRV